MDDGGLGFTRDEAASMAEASSGVGSSPSHGDDFPKDALAAHPKGVKDAGGINGDWEYF